MGKKILLADDSITIQKVIELTFSDEDFDVVTVGNGRLAVERIQELRPDLVLCDIIMPEKDGYEVCDFIKKSPGLAHIPVLLLTGAFEPFDQERAARVGCDGFLAKPFEPQALIGKVKDLLSRAEVQEPPPPPPKISPVLEHFAPEAPPAVPVVQAPYEPISQQDPLEPLFIGETEPEETAPVAADLGEPEVQFIPDEPFVEAVGFGPVEDQTVRAMAPDFGSASPFEEYEVASFDEVVPAAPPQEAEPFPVFEAIDAGMEGLLPITSEEAESLAPTGEGAGDVYKDEEPWTQPTAEVSLEERAQASVQAASVSPGPFFEEVFEEEPALVSLAPEMVEEPVPSEGEEEVLPTLLEEPESLPVDEESLLTVEAPAMEREASAPPVSAPTFTEPQPPPAAAMSPGAPPAVTAEMVSQITERVLSQISEKIIREIAWEVIPDLAEALIKKEIERLKTDLAQS